MQHEVYLFCLSLGAGVFLACIFDFFRAIRKNIPHKNKVVDFEDLIYWIFVAAVLFFLLVRYNEGVIRFYVFLGAGTGAFLYRLLLSRGIFFCFSAFVKGIGWLLRKFFLFFRFLKKHVKKLLILPLKNLWERIKIMCNNI